MKYFILLSILMSFNAQAIELVLNGVTYNIEDYQITNNGQRIVIKHPSLNNIAANRCKGRYSDRKTANTYKKKKYIKYKPSIQRTPSAFDRLLQEFNAKKENELRYQ